MKSKDIEINLTSRDNIHYKRFLYCVKIKNKK